MKVTLPLSLPGIVAGTLLTFIPAAGDFINAQLLGSPQNHMIGNVHPVEVPGVDGLSGSRGDVLHPDGGDPDCSVRVCARGRDGAVDGDARMSSVAMAAKSKPAGWNWGWGLRAASRFDGLLTPIFRVPAPSDRDRDRLLLQSSPRNLDFLLSICSLSTLSFFWSPAK